MNELKLDIEIKGQNHCTPFRNIHLGKSLKGHPQDTPTMSGFEIHKHNHYTTNPYVNETRAIAPILACTWTNFPQLG
jgi:hypothetical protein